MKIELRVKIKEYFKNEFADLILEKLNTGHKLSKFKINPFILIALSSGVFGKLTSKNMAKALLYPRVFGTSISTTFGAKMQKLCVDYLGAKASGVDGIDIEFEDRVDRKQIMMQLKAGPNTLNKDDVRPILAKMTTAWRLLQMNGAGENMPQFAIGITYGTVDEISGHYKAIRSSSIGGQINVLIYSGQDFWHRLTGDENFYSEMISIFFELFEEVDYSDLLETDLKNLTASIEKKYFTGGGFDITKI